MAEHRCTNRAEWRLRQGKSIEHLPSYYQLHCDYGTPLMMSWEISGGNGLVYLCDCHADQLWRSGKDWEVSPAATSQSVGNDEPTEGDSQNPNSEVGRADAHIGEAKPNLSDKVPALDLTNEESAKSSVNDAMDGVVREDFEAHGTALQDEKTSTAATEGKQSEIWDLGRMCRSRSGEPCTCEATVHCPNCGAWFCDAHAEDEKWHPCVLTI